MSNIAFRTDISSYFGGKASSGVYQTIINQIPPHEKFYSGFLGNCAITRFKRKSKITIGYDLDKGVIKSWSNNKDIELRNKSFLNINIAFLCDPSAFFFLDPPYPLSSRKQQRETYNYELTDQQHKELLLLIKSAKSMIAICTYPNELYRKELSKWRLLEYYSMDRQGNRRKEWLFMNYPIPTILHDYRYLGNNFRERERIKRQYNNMIKKFDRLPIVERNMILNALKAKYIDVSI